MPFLLFPSNKHSRHILTISLILFFSGMTLNSQTVIKEKVIINPPQMKTNLKKVSSTESTHSVRVQISMSSNIWCYHVWFPKDETICVVGIGTAVIILPGDNGSVIVEGESIFDLEGTYYYNITWAGPSGQTVCGQSANIQVFLDENLIYTNSTDNACQTWGTFNVAFPNCGPECSSTSPPQVPTFTVDNVYKNGDFGIDYCNNEKHPFGYFYPFCFDKDSQFMFEDFSVDECFNTTTQKWQTSVGGNNIKIRAILDLCLNNMHDDNRIVLESVDDINKTNIPEGSACDAFISFFNHATYPALIGKFIIREFIEKHEQTHLDEFKNTSLPNSLNGSGADGGSFPSYADLFNSFGPECNPENNLDSVKTQAQNYFRDINEKLRKALKEYYRKSSKEENERMINESESLREIIKKYQIKLVELYPEIEDSPCFNYLIWN